MGFRREGCSEDLGRLRMQQFGVFGIHDEPAKLGWKRLEQADIVDQAAQERGLRHPVVAGFGGMRDEITAFQAFLQRADVAARRGSGGTRKNDEQQGG